MPLPTANQRGAQLALWHHRLVLSLQVYLLPVIAVAVEQFLCTALALTGGSIAPHAARSVLLWIRNHRNKRPH